MLTCNSLCIPEMIQQLIDLRVSKITHNGSNSAIPFTFSVQPLSISKKSFDLLIKSTYLWQKALHLASMDLEFIKEILMPCKDEGLVGKLLEILSNKQIIENQSKKPKLQLCRCDYFLDGQNPKLIEYNTSCVSMAGISSKFQKICQKFSTENSAFFPQNNSTVIYAKSISDFYQENNLTGIFLAVVLPEEKNINDQDILFEEISNQGTQKIECHRVIYDQFMQQTSLNCEGDLIFKGNKVAITYFRAGYSSRLGIQADLKIKIGMSSAISIPWIGSELINTKRMQLEISKEDIMAKYLSAEEMVILKESIIESWDFNPPNNNQQNFCQVVKMVQKNGTDLFVLKPNQEGGGNNYFGIQAYYKLKNLTKQERVNYILTRLLKPETKKLTFIRAKNRADYQIQEYISDSQYSIYGTISSNKGGKICKNVADGFLIRSKPKCCNEGGLMNGNGSISGLTIKL